VSYTLGYREDGPDTYVIAVGGELDLGAAPALQGTVDRLLEDGATTLVIDLSEARFIDSTSVGILMSTMHRLKEAGGTLEVVCTEPNLLRVFEIVGLDKHLPIRA
jgi:anti-sigma B factor antagonist